MIEIGLYCEEYNYSGRIWTERPFMATDEKGDKWACATDGRIFVAERVVGTIPQLTDESEQVDNIGLFCDPDGESTTVDICDAKEFDATITILGDGEPCQACEGVESADCAYCEGTGLADPYLESDGDSYVTKVFNRHFNKLYLRAAMRFIAATPTDKCVLAVWKNERTPLLLTSPNNERRALVMIMIPDGHETQKFSLPPIVGWRLFCEKAGDL